MSTPGCAVCRRDNDNSTHSALELTGHLSHGYITPGEVETWTAEERAAHRSSLLAKRIEPWADGPLGEAAIARRRRAEDTGPDYGSSAQEEPAEPQRTATPFGPQVTAANDEVDDGLRLLDIDHFQEKVGAWCAKNFGRQSDLVLYGGTAEEVGEMLRGAVKREQGIRGTRPEWDAEIRKEIGDIAIKLASIAAQEGWSLNNIIARRWWEVSQRDWSGADKTGHGLPSDD